MASKFLDSVGLANLVSHIKTELSTKVDKVEGKGLSTNDYTDADKIKLTGIATNANNYVHPTQTGLTAGTYRSVTVNGEGHVLSGTNPTTLSGYGIKKVEASLIDGVISINNIPKGALERVVTVPDDTARFALKGGEPTGEDDDSGYVQLGDVVKVVSTSKMYYVTDLANLGNNDGYEVFVAGSAASVPWEGIVDPPDKFPPEDHNHPLVTSTSHGFMSIENYVKLSGIEAGANKYTHPTGNGYNHIPAGGASGQILRWDSAGKAVWGNDNNTTYADATQTVHGLMSVSDKIALDGLKTTVADIGAIPTADIDGLFA